MDPDEEKLLANLEALEGETDIEKVAAMDKLDLQDPKTIKPLKSGRIWQV